MANSPQEVLVQCRQHDVKAVALCVTDVLGKLHQLTIPVARLTEESFEDGFAWTNHRLADKRGEVTDVLLMPQPTTAYIQPFAELPTLSLLCTMHDPLTREEINFDPRTIAIKAQKYANDAGVADAVLLTLTLEFFLFDNHPSQRSRRRPKQQEDVEPGSDVGEAVRALRPTTTWRLDDDIRSMAMHALCDCGVNIASQRGSDETRSKSSFEMTETDLVMAADQVMIAKHVIRRLAAKEGKSATFMPLPIAGLNPAGLTTQLALLRHENCALSGSGYAGLSEAGLHAIGGILRHAAAISAFCNATTNSYARLGVCAGSLPLVAYSQCDLRAALRVPNYHAGKHKRLEYRLPDAASNPYLGFAAILMAAIDGIQNKIHPGPALDPDPYAPVDQLSTTYQRVPASLEAALEALEQDAEFLLRGDVFTPELVEGWIKHKRMFDIATKRSQPHPHEIASYFDA